MEKIIDRFDNYMKFKKLNDNKVTIDLGISVGVIGKSRGEGKDLSRKMVEKILNFYTDLNPIYLLTGEGEMINDESTSPPRPQKDDQIIQYLMEENIEYRKTIGVQADTISKMSDQLIALQKKIDEKGTAPAAPGAGAICANAG